MDIQLSFFLVISVFCASLAQKKKTTVTGSVTKKEGSGIRVDLGIARKHKNFEFGGSVFGDSKGNRGVNVGLKWKFGKRSAAWTGEHFEVVIMVNHCDFNVYDINEDSVITIDEIYELFPERVDAHRLFKALDFTSADGKVTIEEFKFMAPQVIKTCRHNKTVGATRRMQKHITIPWKFTSL
ncbi:unnamed protein product [Mytilus coruscus]|uniref:EF-hand domain-containing protein n=1 Tax=Mytilus coruscus TaxID=42192 RepID=A0A6J8BQ16_MYTCO|nr:unnamed protein product [Mytilus coruscus]